MSVWNLWILANHFRWTPNDICGWRQIIRKNYLPNGEIEFLTYDALTYTIWKKKGAVVFQWNAGSSSFTLISMKLSRGERERRKEDTHKIRCSYTAMTLLRDSITLRHEPHVISMIRAWNVKTQQHSKIEKICLYV